MLPLDVSLTDGIDELVGIFRDPRILLGIPLALLGAVLMSFGAQYQHRGVQKVERLSGKTTGGLSRSQLKKLLTRPSWVAGAIMLGLAVVFQLAALSVAPLILVQPLGAIALVITTILNARVTHHKPNRRSLVAIAACVGGIFIFVTIAAFFATEHEVTDAALTTILSVLAAVVVVFGVVWILLRRRAPALFYIMAAGVIYGFVATLTKVVISRIQTGDFGWLSLICAVALIAAALVGGYFVQTAYSAGPPDLVIAGLTVIDPIVAVLIGLTVLGEASTAPAWALIGFAIAGAIATWGVIQLTRHHPQITADGKVAPPRVK
ncbi:MAG: multidrug DMT transporter permease [Actinobacteria bacterium]|nr:multidrug DMT transporter permease [Actinomycetota bacterium]